MTLEEAIADKDRPLSMTPMEWMQYEEASEEEDRDLVDDSAQRIVAEETGDDDPSAVVVEPGEKLDIGIEQMVLGCKMAMRALQELSRADVGVADRKAYDTIGDLIHNAVGPYLVEVLDARRASYPKE